MDWRAALVATVFGLSGGLLLARYRDDRRPIVGSTFVAVIAGVLTWLVEPSHLAGPSLALGGAAMLAGIGFAGSRRVP